VAAAPGTAVLTTPGGATVSGVRAFANGYVFQNVPLVQPGSGAPAVYRITNMQANTLFVPAGSVVLGIALLNSATPINTNIQVWSMARVQ
jgi:hypothetical protein